MSQVVQAKCPHCKRLLRIPVEWVSQPMRCKHCRQVFQARQQPPAGPAPKPVSVTPARPAVPVAAPYAPPPAKPVPVPVIVNGSTAPPHATPTGTPPPPRPRRHWWKGLVLALSVLAAAGVLAVALGPQIAGLFNPKRGDGDKEPPKVVQNKDKPGPPVLHPSEDKAAKDKDPPKGDGKKGPDDAGKPKVDPKDKQEPPKDRDAPAKDLSQKEPPKKDPPKVDPPKK